MTPRPTGRRVAPTVAGALALAAWAAAAIAAAPVSALVLDSGDGLGNTSPPPGLAGWANVGRRLGGPSIVYLGDRWVLTADHVGAGIVVIDGERYNAIASTLHQLRNDDGSLADLLLYRIDGDPRLPPLDLARRTPRPGEEVVLVGMGASRGVALTVRSPRYGLLDGWSWGPDRTKRWGTNIVAGRPRTVPGAGATTWSIPTLFDRIDDPNGTDHEAAAAEGDSGGALFARADPADPDLGYVLVGVLFSVSSLPEQPRSTSLYGGATYAADVSYYREQVLSFTRAGCPEARGRAGGGRDRHGVRAVCDAPTDVVGTSASEVLDHDAGTALLVGLAGLLAWRLLALWRARHSGVT